MAATRAHALMGKRATKRGAKRGAKRRATLRRFGFENCPSQPTMLLNLRVFWKRSKLKMRCVHDEIMGLKWDSYVKEGTVNWGTKGKR